LRVEAELFRITQEALANVRRHANATEVIIRLVRDADGVRLEVRDNGSGFNPRMVGPNRQGIVGMRERAGLLGGKLVVKSRRSRSSGTTVIAAVPLGADA
jgi:signal transduction histidine kinase